MLDALTLNCVDQRASQQAAIELTLDQVVLRTELHQPAAKFRIVPFGQHPNWRSGSRRPDAIHRLLRGTVSKRQAQQHGLEAVGSDNLESVAQTGNKLDLKPHVLALGQRELHQPRVCGRVLDQQNFYRRIRHACSSGANPSCVPRVTGGSRIEIAWQRLALAVNREPDESQSAGVSRIETTRIASE